MNEFSLPMMTEEPDFVLSSKIDTVFDERKWILSFSTIEQLRDYLQKSNLTAVRLNLYISISSPNASMEQVS